MRTGILITRGEWKFWEPCPREKVRATLGYIQGTHKSVLRDATAVVEFITIDDADHRVGEAELIPAFEYGR